MAGTKISPEKITKPIQLQAVWFVGLIALVSALLTGATQIDQPPWICPLLVISAILMIPFFVVLIFVLQTKYRTQFLDDDHYAEYIKRQENMIDLMENKINESTQALVNSSTSLKDVTKLGINRVCSDNEKALETLVQDIENEKSKIYFVGLSLKGILSESGPNRFLQAIEQKAKTPGFQLRFLLTHPSLAGFREQQENRHKGDIEREILNSISVLQSVGVETSSIRFYKAPPLATAIFTSRKMLFVPYSNSASPTDSVSFIVENTNESSFYSKMLASHFDEPWLSGIAVPLDEENPKPIAELEKKESTQFIDPWSIDIPKRKDKDKR